MLSQEERLKIFWASSPQNTRAIPTFEFSHSALSVTPYYWTERYEGYVTLETGESVLMSPCNAAAKPADADNVLDQNYSFSFDLTDSQDTLRKQLNKISIDNREPLLIRYRQYLSDNLATVQSSIELTVVSIAYNVEGATFSCVTPRGALTYTGELYTPFDVPMLRGFL